MVEINPEQLSSTQLENYKIAQQAIKEVPAGMHRIRAIVVATELPATNNSHNAFSESYHFDSGTGKLSIRAERLDSVGEMLTVLAHANAHIQCGSMESDQVPFSQKQVMGVDCGVCFAGPKVPTRVLWHPSETVECEVDCPGTCPQCWAKQHFWDVRHKGG